MDDFINVYYTVDQLMKAYALEVRKARKEKKISQEKLATISNVSLGSIKRFESSGNISFVSLLQICEALKIKISFESQTISPKIKLYE